MPCGNLGALAPGVLIQLFVAPVSVMPIHMQEQGFRCQVQHQHVRQRTRIHSGRQARLPARDFPSLMHPAPIIMQELSIFSPRLGIASAADWTDEVCFEHMRASRRGDVVFPCSQSSSPAHMDLVPGGCADGSLS